MNAENRCVVIKNVLKRCLCLSQLLKKGYLCSLNTRENDEKEERHSRN